MQPARLPLNIKSIKEAQNDASLVYKMMNTCNQKIDIGMIEESQEAVKSLMNYCSVLKDPFLIYPNLRKEYRNFVLNVINLYPSLKELGLNSIYRILDFRDDYYYIK